MKDMEMYHIVRKISPKEETKIKNITQFGRMLNPFGFLHGKQKVYARIIDIIFMDPKGEHSQRGDLHISLLTEEMMEADYAYFSGENTGVFQSQELKKRYKPYYYEFTAVFGKEEKKKLFSLEERFRNKWFTAWLTSDFLSEDNFYIDGIVEFSASPFREHACRFIWDQMSEEVTESERKKIDAMSLPKKDDERLLKKKFLECFGNKRQKFQIKVYNVGQANCIYIRNKRHRIFFDVGIPKDPESKSIDRKKGEVKQSMAAIRRSRPTMIILSHWDMDHIKGAFLLQRSAFDIWWITPGICSEEREETKMKFSKSAERLAKYLFHRQRLLRVSWDKNGEEICRGEKGILWKGDGKRRTLNSQNNYGLLLEVIDSQTGEKAVLSGDCEYMSWPRKLLRKKFKTIVVPHHGSNMNSNNINRIAPGTGDAIISVGCDGRTLHGWDHPNKDHENDLIKAGYRVMETKMLSNKIKIFKI